MNKEDIINKDNSNKSFYYVDIKKLTEEEKQKLELFLNELSYYCQWDESIYINTDIWEWLFWIIYYRNDNKNLEKPFELSSMYNDKKFYIDHLWYNLVEFWVKQLISHIKNMYLLLIDKKKKRLKKELDMNEYMYRLITEINIDEYVKLTIEY